MKREGQERGESKRRGERGRYYSAKQQRAGGSGEWGREDRRRGSRVEDRKRGAGQGLGGEGEQESAAQLCIAASRNRQHISTTSQEPVLFGGSIFENIAYGNRQSALPRQQHAARSTLLSGTVFVPGGFVTVLQSQRTEPPFCCRRGCRRLGP